MLIRILLLDLLDALDLIMNWEQVVPMALYQVLVPSEGLVVAMPEPHPIPLPQRFADSLPIIA